MDKLIVSKDWFGKVFMDTGDELGLGPFDWVMLGDRNITGSVDGRMASIDLPGWENKREKLKTERENKL